MGYALRLVDRVRRETGNTDYIYGSYGLGVRYFLDKLNDAQERLQSLVSAIDRSFFETTQVINLVALTNSYALNGQCLTGQHVAFVEFSDSGDDDDYKPLVEMSPLEFTYEEDDFIQGYYIRNNKIVLSPTPMSSTGKIRVIYLKSWNTLSTRIGKISTNNATTITLNASPNPSTELVFAEDGTTFDMDYLTVVDDNGVVLNSSISTTGYTTATRIFNASVGAGVTLTVGAWVIAGQYATTHTQFPSNWDRYLISYAKRMILAGEDGSDTFDPEDKMFQRIEADILESVMSLKTRSARPTLTSGYYR